MSLRDILGRKGGGGYHSIRKKVWFNLNSGHFFFSKKKVWTLIVRGELNENLL